jgi:phage terminase large subunit
VSASPRTSLAQTILRWRRSAGLFVRECLHGVPDPWQDKVLEQVSKPETRRVALKACKGPGKTCLLAWVILWFLVCFPTPKVAATSITGDNLRDCLWTELALWIGKSELCKDLLVWSAERIVHRESPATWWASARRWPREADGSKQADTLAGLHGEYLLFVVDEAGGIPDSVIAAAEAGLATGTRVMLIIAGNPTETEGPLWRACTSERHLWWVWEITGDPDDPLRAPRISIEWAREQIQKYGADNPWVLTNVFGKFPPTQSDKLFGPELCARSAKAFPKDFHRSPKVVSVDCAGFGDDRSVIFKRQGPVLYQADVFRNLHGWELADHAMRIAMAFEPDGLFVDAVGIGQACSEHLALHGFAHTPCNAGSKSAEPEMFENKKAECWWKAKEWMEQGGAIPDDGELIRELTSVKYWYDKRQRIVIEPTEDIKARLGNSPDKAAAFVQSFYAPVIPKLRKGQYPSMVDGIAQKCRCDYDPTEV